MDDMDGGASVMSGEGRLVPMGVLESYDANVFDDVMDDASHQHILMDDDDDDSDIVNAFVDSTDLLRPHDPISHHDAAFNYHDDDQQMEENNDSIREWRARAISLLGGRPLETQVRELVAAGEALGLNEFTGNAVPEFHDLYALRSAADKLWATCRQKIPSQHNTRRRSSRTDNKHNDINNNNNNNNKTRVRNEYITLQALKVLNQEASELEERVLLDAEVATNPVTATADLLNLATKWSAHVNILLVESAADPTLRPYDIERLTQAMEQGENIRVQLPELARLKARLDLHSWVRSLDSYFKGASPRSHHAAGGGGGIGAAAAAVASGGRSKRGRVIDDPLAALDHQTLLLTRTDEQALQVSTSPSFDVDSVKNRSTQRLLELDISELDEFLSKQSDFEVIEVSLAGERKERLDAVVSIVHETKEVRAQLLALRDAFARQPQGPDAQQLGSLAILLLRAHSSCCQFDERALAVSMLRDGAWLLRVIDALKQTLPIVATLDSNVFLCNMVASKSKTKRNQQQPNSIETGTDVLRCLELACPRQRDQIIGQDEGQDSDDDNGRSVKSTASDTGAFNLAAAVRLFVADNATATAGENGKSDSSTLNPSATPEQTDNQQTDKSDASTSREGSVGNDDGVMAVETLGDTVMYGRRHVKNIKAAVFSLQQYLDAPVDPPISTRKTSASILTDTKRRFLIQMRHYAMASAHLLGLELDFCKQADDTKPMMTPELSQEHWIAAMDTSLNVPTASMDVDTDAATYNNAQVMNLESWKRKLVGSLLDVDWQDKWWSAKVINYDARVGLHSLVYEDGAPETLRLQPGGVAFSPDGKERVEWQLMPVSAFPVEQAWIDNALVVLGTVPAPEEGKEEEEEEEEEEDSDISDDEMTIEALLASTTNETKKKKIKKLTQMGALGVVQKSFQDDMCDKYIEVEWEDGEWCLAVVRECLGDSNCRIRYDDGSEEVAKVLPNGTAVSVDGSSSFNWRLTDKEFDVQSESSAFESSIKGSGDERTLVGQAAADANGKKRKASEEEEKNENQNDNGEGHNKKRKKSKLKLKKEQKTEVSVESVQLRRSARPSTSFFASDGNSIPPTRPGQHHSEESRKRMRDYAQERANAIQQQKVLARQADQRLSLDEWSNRRLDSLLKIYRESIALRVAKRLEDHERAVVAANTMAARARVRQAFDAMFRKATAAESVSKKSSKVSTKTERGVNRPLETVADALECELYSLKPFGADEEEEDAAVLLVNRRAYLEQSRSLCFNLGRNDQLRRRLMRGEVTEREICGMSAEEMADDALKHQRQETRQRLEQDQIIRSGAPPAPVVVTKPKLEQDVADAGLESQNNVDAIEEQNADELVVVKNEDDTSMVVEDGSDVDVVAAALADIVDKDGDEDGSDYELPEVGAFGAESPVETAETTDVATEEVVKPVKKRTRWGTPKTEDDKSKKTAMIAWTGTIKAPPRMSAQARLELVGQSDEYGGRLQQVLAPITILNMLPTLLEVKGRIRMEAATKFVKEVTSLTSRRQLMTGTMHIDSNNDGESNSSSNGSPTNMAAKLKRYAEELRSSQRAGVIEESSVLVYLFPVGTGPNQVQAASKNSGRGVELIACIIVRPDDVSGQPGVVMQARPMTCLIPSATPPAPLRVVPSELPPVPIVAVMKVKDVALSNGTKQKQQPVAVSTNVSPPLPVSISPIESITGVAAPPSITTQPTTEQLDKNYVAPPATLGTTYVAPVAGSSSDIDTSGSGAVASISKVGEKKPEVAAISNMYDPSIYDDGTGGGYYAIEASATDTSNYYATEQQHDSQYSYDYPGYYGAPPTDTNTQQQQQRQQQPQQLDNQYSQQQQYSNYYQSTPEYGQTSTPNATTNTTTYSGWPPVIAAAVPPVQQQPPVGARIDAAAQNVIVQTALFCARAGPAAMEALKAQQAASPDLNSRLGFLEHSHPHHSFFQQVMRDPSRWQT